MDELLNELYRNIIDTSWIEFVAVFFGLLSVWYAKKENILVYPTGIINVLIFVYLCYHAGLYAEMGINTFYFVMSVYGWYSWTRKNQNKEVLPISRCNRLYHMINMSALIVFFFSLRFVLTRYTDSTVPTLDALTTSLFIVAMWLMARKKIENWILWIIGDLISIPMYAYKGLALSGFQFFIFLILAILGYIEWRRKLIASNPV
jgi:nicotinamide mononucleotide transporter